MKTKKFFIFLLLFVGVTFFNLRIISYLDLRDRQYRLVEKAMEEIDPLAHNFLSSNTPPLNLKSYDLKIEGGDGRVANLKRFFRKYDSPLFPYAEKIVEVSDKYNFDYRLLPAIAMQESNLCKKIPEDSYNCWGWGIYGEKVTRFKSYNEAIETVAKGIKKHYINHGLISVRSIMNKYNPSSNGSWARGVIHFLLQLE